MSSMSSIKVKVMIGVIKFLHLPQYKMSGPITKLWHIVREMKLRHVVVYNNIFDMFNDIVGSSARLTRNV